MLTLYAQEEKNPWESAAANPAAAVLALFEDNPFARFDEMYFEETLQWETYERRKLLDDLTNNPHANIDARASHPFYFKGSLARHPLANVVSFTLNDGYLSPPGKAAQALEYLERWRQALPSFSWGGANADRRASDFLLNEELRPLPDCFGSHPGWYHLISPRGYAPYFDADDLRRLPAHRVEERPDATFAIMSYPDPLDFESAEAQRRIVEMTRHLNARRKDARAR